VIRLGLTLGIATKILLAICAPNSVLAHALGSFFSDGLSLVIFLVIVNFAFNNLHHISATASHQRFILSYEIVLLQDI
jgi:hypothetical protein